MIINNKYRGTQTVAVTRFRDDYNVKIADSLDELQERLKVDRISLGKKLERYHETLAIYRRVNTRLCLPIIEQATYDLRHGKHINLENLLA